MVNKSMYDLTEFIGKINILITNKNCSIGHVLGHLTFIELSIIRFIYLFKGLFYKKNVILKTIFF